MTRILLLLIIFVSIYYFIKRSLGGLFSQPGEPFGQSNQSSTRPKTITDQLVKDPVCGTYCPKREAFTLEIGGEVIHFCSDKCKNKFLANKDNW